MDPRRSSKVSAAKMAAIVLLNLGFVVSIAAEGTVFPNTKLVSNAAASV